jgi:type III restriction enzyme
MSGKNLQQQLIEDFGRRNIERSELPEFIFANLRPGYDKRPYQQNAFRYFLCYWNEFERKPLQNHQLLFHMATGSGKTLIMGGLIIYLYKQGYRNFLFFVNSNTIIEKTRDNFLNSSSSKYLFAENISIDGKEIRINAVENFQAANQDDINIVFSTIQGLHVKLNEPQENALTYTDFDDKKIVLISDEAHHINADTKKKKKEEQLKAKLDADVDFSKMKEDELEVISWEGTVNRIFQANPQNILLEFTATVDITDPSIAEKYNDKLVFDYPLKEFRKDGYSKEVKVLQADLPPFERALQAVLLSQYRLKMFARYRQRIKPVILFKSQRISDSENFVEEFSGRIRRLRPVDILGIRDNAVGDPVIRAMFSFFEAEQITFENLIEELKLDFAPSKLITVNSKAESQQKQIALNTLEDEKNQFRAVFAVDKLNEGWDVLNLFDIVRLHVKRDAKSGKPGKSTVSEAQLIGRGARYCPFRVNPDQSLAQRKFDGDVNHELRICEELYYHAQYNPRYIQELNTALEEIGIKSQHAVTKTISLKPEFKASKFYKSGFIFLNKLEEYDRSDCIAFPNNIRAKTYSARLSTGYISSSIAFEKAKENLIETETRVFTLNSLGRHVIRKALNKIFFYSFSDLVVYFPKLRSIDEFITSEQYLGSIRSIEVTGKTTQLHNLSADDKLDIAMKVLNEIATSLKAEKTEYRGSRTFEPVMLSAKIYDKVRNYDVDEDSDKEEGRSMVHESPAPYHLDLSKKDWFAFEDCFGTSEEKNLIRYIDTVIGKLKTVYDEVYLVRNERHFKIYNFEDGKALEPDFVLFLNRKNGNEKVHYQIFIEPKGKFLLATDKWKEDFLKILKSKDVIKQFWEGHNYNVWGLPFYNEEMRKAEFDESFKMLIQ